MYFKILILLICSSILLLAREHDYKDIKCFIEKTRESKVSMRIISFLELNEINKAIDLIESSINKKHKDLYLDYMFLGDLYTKINNQKNAISSYEKSIVLNKYNANVYYKLSIQKYCTKESINLLNKVIELNSEFQDAYFNLAYMYRTCIINYEKAEENFKKILLLNDSDYETYYQLALLYNSMNKHEKAIYYAYKTIEINKSYSYAYLLLYNIYLEKNNISKSSEHLNFIKKKLESNINNNEDLFSLAYIYASEKDYESAIKLYKSLLKKELNNNLYYNVNKELSYIYKTIGNDLFAMKYLEEIMENIYFDNNDIINLAFLYQRNSKKELLLILLKNIKDNNSYIENYNIGVIYYLEKEPYLANKFLLKAININPNSLEANLLYFDNLTIQNSNVENKKHLISLEKKFPKSIEVKIRMYMHYYLTKDLKKSKRKIEEIKSLIDDKETINRINSSKEFANIVEIINHYLSKKK